MPIYSYRCECGNLFDELVPIKDRANAPCPECNALARQIITPVALDNLRMGLDPDFTTFGDRWAKIHEDRAKKENRDRGRE